LKISNELEIEKERDVRMHSQDSDPIKTLPGKVDQLLEGLNRVC